MYPGYCIALFVVGGAPNLEDGIGGIVVADGVHNATGAPYGGGLFNGALQLFRPSSGAQSGMPWVLLGDEFGNEVAVLSYCKFDYDYFADGKPGDTVLRQFTPGKRLLLGQSNGTDGHRSTLNLGPDDAVLNGHLVASGQTPTVTAVNGTTDIGAGGHDLAGQIALTTGPSVPVDAAIASVTWHKPFVSTPVVMVQGITGPSVDAQPYAVTTGNGVEAWELRLRKPPTQATRLAFNVMAIGQ